MLWEIECAHVAHNRERSSHLYPTELRAWPGTVDDGEAPSPPSELRASESLLSCSRQRYWLRGLWQAAAATSPSAAQRSSSVRSRWCCGSSLPSSRSHCGYRKCG